MSLKRHYWFIHKPIKKKYNAEYQKKIIFCDYCGDEIHKANNSRHCITQKHIDSVEIVENIFEKLDSE